MKKLNGVLLVAIVGFALWVVTTQHKARSIYSQLDRTQNQIEQLNAEYEQLQLEQSTWGAHNLVDKAATTRLGMHPPSKEETVVINANKSLTNE